MAKNREHEKIVEADSDPSDDDSSSEETGSKESDSDSEPELTQLTKKPSSSTPAAAKKPQHQAASKPQEPPPTSSFDGKESGSDSESDSDEPIPKVRSKPTQKSTNGARKSRSKSSAADPVTPTRSAALKRPADEKGTDAKDAKKSKKKAEPETSEKKPTDDPKKTLFQRLWSEEDEIAILKGLIDYTAKKKTGLIVDLNTFHDSIIKNLHPDGQSKTKVQLQDKIRKLKKKYENNRSKEKKSSKEMTFVKPHEQIAYEMSKKIWGNENVKEKVVGSPKPKAISLRKAAIKRANNEEAKDDKEAKAGAAVDADMESVLLAKRVKPIGATVEERILMIGAEMFENRKGDAGEKEWNKLRMEEMQVYLRHLEVKSAQARVVIERLMSDGICG